jgi:hypothetical protein
MAATKNLEGFGGASQLTCTLTSLASGSTRESAVQSNTTNDYFDYLVSLTFTIASGSPSTLGGNCVNIYANASNDGTIWPIIQLSAGTTFTTGAGDASVGALGNPPNIRLIGSVGIQTTTSSAERTFRSEPFSLAQAFGGNIPSSFSIMIENSSGVVFSASTATTAQYLQINGIYTTSGN